MQRRVSKVDIKLKYSLLVASLYISSERGLKCFKVDEEF